MSSITNPWQMPSEIVYPNILIVEGQDEAYFFDSFLKFLKSSNEISHVKFHIIDIGGKDVFRSKKGISLLIKSYGFTEIVRSVAIIRDAEEHSAESAFKSINQTLQKVGLSKPNIMNKFTLPSDNKISAGIFIMPNCKDSGMLEDLCLQSIPFAFHKCYDDFSICIGATNIKQLSKSKVQSYLALQNPLSNRLGHSARENIWKFEHPCFNEIKSFLLEFAKQPI